MGWGAGCVHAHVPERDFRLDFPHVWTLGSDSHRAENTLILQTFLHSFSLVSAHLGCKYSQGISRKVESLREKFGDILVPKRFTRESYFASVSNL